MPKLNYHRHLSFDQGDHSKLVFGDNLQQQIINIYKTNRVRFAISKKIPLTLAVPSQSPLMVINSPKIKSSVLSCTEAEGN